MFRGEITEQGYEQRSWKYLQEAFPKRREQLEGQETCDSVFGDRQRGQCGCGREDSKRDHDPQIMGFGKTLGQTFLRRHSF